jgi:transcriptional regulator with XRE-family HTH domain
MDSARKYSSPNLKNILKSNEDKEYSHIESRMGIAVRIASRLKEIQLSKLQFSKILHVQPSMVTRWLSGTHNFTSDTLTDIQKALGIALLNTKNESQATSNSYIGKGYAFLLLKLKDEFADADTTAILKVPAEKKLQISVSRSKFEYASSDNNAISVFHPCSPKIN